MSGSHAHALYFHGHSAVHRLAPETKLVAQFLFVLIVVATPREAFWAFGLYAALVLLAAAWASIPATFLLRRLAIEIPFVAFAFFLPFVGQGERVDVLGVSLSVEGLWGAWNILAKATIGVLRARCWRRPRRWRSSSPGSTGCVCRGRSRRSPRSWCATWT